MNESDKYLFFLFYFRKKYNPSKKIDEWETVDVNWKWFECQKTKVSILRVEAPWGYCRIMQIFPQIRGHNLYLCYVHFAIVCVLELASKELNHFGVIADLFRQIVSHSSRFVLF